MNILTGFCLCFLIGWASGRIATLAMTLDLLRILEPDSKYRRAQSSADVLATLRLVLQEPTEVGWFYERRALRAVFEEERLASKR